MFGIESGIRLPNELLVIISKKLEDTDCLALAISGQLEGYDAVYDDKREGNAVNVSYKYHFMTHPRSWYTFFRQHPLYPSAITILNFNDCYWIPAGLICSAIRKMVNLEELKIKGTQISLQHLGHVFESCKKMKKLEFNILEKSWKDIQEVVQNEKLDCIKEGVRKLTGLKLFTCFLDARDYLNDPWLLIIRILSWCRDCKDLSVEITYTGDDFERENRQLNTDEEEALQMVKTDLFPNLVWMTKLRSLALVKLGDFSTSPERNRFVRPLLLEDLLKHLSSSPERSPDSLQQLWVHDFKLHNYFSNIWRTDESSEKFPLKSFYVQEKCVHLVNQIDPETRLQCERLHFNFMSRDQRFGQVEHLGLITLFSEVHTSESNDNLGPLLPNLKYARVFAGMGVKNRQLNYFLRSHPALEFLHANFCFELEAIPDFSDVELSNLKVLSLSRILLGRELAEKLAQVCPNLEVLRLDNRSIRQYYDIMDGDFLPHIRFRSLKSLHLYGRFELNDGAFLLQIIQQCPKLRSLQICGPLEPDVFFPNFDLFLKSAVNLKDLRFGLDIRGTETLLLVLKSLLQYAPDLERLFLFDFQPELQKDVCNNPSGLADFMVQFALKMKRLVALCIVSPLIEENVMQNIRSGIVEKVVPVRKALWFHIDDKRPVRSAQDVAGIHYNEIIEPGFYFPPPF